MSTERLKEIMEKLRNIQSECSETGKVITEDYGEVPSPLALFDVCIMVPIIESTNSILFRIETYLFLRNLREVMVFSEGKEKLERVIQYNYNSTRNFIKDRIQMYNRTPIKDTRCVEILHQWEDILHDTIRALEDCEKLD